MSEKFSPKRVVQGIALIGGTVLLALSAFPKSARDKIKENANYKCEVLRNKKWGMECAHLVTHDKSHPNYNDPEFGRYVSNPVHLAQHLAYKHNADIIGLTEEQNDFAINQQKRKVYERAVEKNIPLPTNEQMAMYAEAVEYLTSEMCRRNGWENPYDKLAERMNQAEA